MKHIKNITQAFFPNLIDKQPEEDKEKTRNEEHVDDHQYFTRVRYFSTKHQEKIDIFEYWNESKNNLKRNWYGN